MSSFPRTVIFLLLAIAFGSEFKAQHLMGLLSDNTDTTLVQRLDLGGPSIYPMSYSLVDYAPRAGEQLEGSCVSWAAGYCGMTIANRLEGSINNTETFSARNIHARYNATKKISPCSDGATFVPVLNLLVNNGAQKSDGTDICEVTSASENYDNKLYAFHDLKVTERNLKAALVRKYPVVIAVRSCENDWSSSQNHVNHVWNGKKGKPHLSGHAMCIIGYNDTLQGGAFYIQNSWGEKWGDMGRFWIRYKDLDVVEQAYCLRYKTTPDYDDKSITTRFFRVYNKTNSNCYLSVAKKLKGQWVSEGWYAIPVGQFYDYYIGDRESNEFYWMASAQKNSIMWTGDGEGSREFGYEPKTRFSIPEFVHVDDKIKFKKAEPSGKRDYYVEKLTLAEVKTRGGDDEWIALNESALLDTRQPREANLKWKSDFLLFDYFSNELILPVIRDYTVFFNVWYWQSNILKNENLTPEVLENLHELKFGSEQTARLWKESVN